MRTRSLHVRAIGLMLAATVGGTAAGMASASEMPESDEPIKLAVNSWTGAQITTHLAGGVLERVGYDVDYVNAGYFPQFAAIPEGDLHATLEVWSNNGVEQFENALATGRAVALGNLGIEANEGWAYPSYVEDECPGLPDWQALNDCVEVFATPETYPNGRILSYPADWAGRTDRMIEGFDLPYESVPGGSEGAMMAELRSAVQRQDPIVMMIWAPHWIFHEVDLRWVDKPAWTPECEEDPSWGPNPDATHDCNVDAPELFKMAWIGLEEQWPGAHAILDQFEYSAEEQIAMIHAVDVEERSLDAVVDEWLDDNEATWQAWVERARQ